MHLYAFFKKKKKNLLGHVTPSNASQSTILIYYTKKMMFLTFIFSLWWNSRSFHYENTPFQIYWKFYHQKNENFQIKFWYFSYFCSKRRGGSNEYQQSMFLSRNKKNNVYPCKPQFYYIKVGFKGAKLYRYVFVMHWTFFDNCLFNEPF